MVFISCTEVKSRTIRVYTVKQQTTPLEWIDDVTAKNKTKFKTITVLVCVPPPNKLYVVDNDSSAPKKQITK